ncbi:MAG TPA: hypothetical protein VKF82_12540 [Candidatus Eremiobacteraceae bacterium]|nr:hypothetical protein [Candidatus Eremiobacteraceae bacterium]
MRSRVFRFSLGLVVALLALSAIGLADTTPGIESTPIPAAKKPDFSSLKFSLGTWSCSSRSARRPAPYTSTGTSSIDPSGYWIVTDTATAKTSWAPATNSVDKITYDSDQHRWVDVYTDDVGGYDVSYSPGWSGSTMVWTDALFTPGPDIIATSPTTMTKVSDTKMTSHSTFKEKSGRTIAVDSVCTKS